MIALENSNIQDRMKKLVVFWGGRFFRVVHGVDTLLLPI